MEMNIEIPTSETNTLSITVRSENSTVFLGANGTGKSRLGIFIEEFNPPNLVHRIAAQRSLELPEEVFLEPYAKALASHRPEKSEKKRQEQSPGAMEQGYDQMLAVLFAEQALALERAYTRSKGKRTISRPETLISRLQLLWSELMPHRELVFAEGTVRTIRIGGIKEGYAASLMSDGERVILYMIGQALLVPKDGILLVDEPENHLNRAIAIRLWDLIEQERSDCGFIYITHDVDFTASRRLANKYAVLDYTPATYKISGKARKSVSKEELTPPAWTIEPIPEVDLPDDIVTRVIGSRKPVLFIEGGQNSLDIQIYRNIYSAFTVIPVGSCTEVVRCMQVFKAQKSLNLPPCAGIVDADGLAEIGPNYSKIGIKSLKVNEIENIFLIPEVFLSIASGLLFSHAEANAVLQRVKDIVFEVARREMNFLSLKHTGMRVYLESGRMAVKAQGIDDFVEKYENRKRWTDPRRIFDDFYERLEKMISDRNYDELLKVYGNKGLLDIAADALGKKGRKSLESFIIRSLATKKDGEVATVLRGHLPEIAV